MTYILENLKEFELLGILDWHTLGYTGKGIKMAEIESCRMDLSLFDDKLYDPFNIASTRYNSHGQKVLDIMHQVAPDADLYMLPSGIRILDSQVNGSFLEKTLKFAISHGVHLINASIGGISNKELNARILEVQKHGTTFVTSAGNSGKKGIDGYAKDSAWISVGAVHYNERKGAIRRSNYSSIGDELDFVSFSNLCVHNVKEGKEVFQQKGTSFSSPLFTGMLALVQHFFLVKVGRTLQQEEICTFVQDYCVDLEEPGFDKYTGYGLFVLPYPEEITVHKYLKKGRVDLDKNEPDKIILHHSLTKDDKTMDYDTVKNYHIRQKGWKDIGYHYVIEKIGNEYEILTGRDEKTMGAHTKGQNASSIGICLVGNFDADIVPYEQLEKLIELIKNIFSRYGKLPIYGHNDFPNPDTGHIKSCPGLKFPWEELEQSLQGKQSKPEISKWAEKPQEWIVEEGISDGTNPRSYVTREQLWTMLYRYNLNKNKEMTT